MRFTDEVAVPADPEVVFDTLTDVGRAVGCLPGAWIDGREGDVHTGGLRVRLGPVTPVYRGAVRLLAVDPGRRRLALDARGRDDAGSGPAGARLDVAVVPGEDGGSRLHLDADLVVRGRVARGGRGVVAEVSHELLGRFAERLGTLAAAETEQSEQTEPAGAEPGATGSGTTGSGLAEPRAAEPEPVEARRASALGGLPADVALAGTAALVGLGALAVALVVTARRGRDGRGWIR